MTTLSTHVLDTTDGLPAGGMEVRLDRWTGDTWDELNRAATNEDGRISFGEVSPGRHRLAFETGEHGNEFFPFVHIVFEVDESRELYHVPLLLSRFGYTTYRGS